MSLEIKVNGKSLSARRGASIFECSEALGVHVPTSCNKNGKCRECIVEIREGAELLSKLEHPNIVRYLGSSRDKEYLNTN